MHFAYTHLACKLASYTNTAQCETPDSHMRDASAVSCVLITIPTELMCPCTALVRISEGQVLDNAFAILAVRKGDRMGLIVR